MVVFAEISLYNQPFEVNCSNMAGAFGSNGESDCRSIGSWQATEECWYFNIVGNTNGEEITFKVYDGLSDSIYNCIEIIIFDSDATIGTPDDPFLLSSLFAPTDITINIDIDTSFPTISWTSVNGALSYYIYSGDSPIVDTTPGSHIAQVSVTTWSDSNGSKKFYVVTSSGDSLLARK